MKEFSVVFTQADAKRNLEQGLLPIHVIKEKFLKEHGLDFPLGEVSSKRFKWTIDRDAGAGTFIITWKGDEHEIRRYWKAVCNSQP